MRDPDDVRLELDRAMSAAMTEREGRLVLVYPFSSGESSDYLSRTLGKELTELADAYQGTFQWYFAEDQDLGLML